MSVGLTGSLGFGVTPANITNVAASTSAAAAGTGLAQASGQETARAVQDVFVQQRSLEAAQQTEDAQGIGQTDGEDNRSNERDADGRTPWMLGRRAPATPEEEEAEAALAEENLQADDANASDEPGSHLDLSG
jgi:hypothetical protein